MTMNTSSLGRRLLLLLFAAANLCIVQAAVPLSDILDSSANFKRWMCEHKDTCPESSPELIEGDPIRFLRQIVLRVQRAKEENKGLFPSSGNSPRKEQQTLFAAIVKEATKKDDQHGKKNLQKLLTDPNGFWGFVPKLLVSSMMGGAAAQMVDSSCYPGAQLSVSVGGFTLDTTTGDASYDVTLTVPPNASTPMFCVNRFFFASARGSAVIEVPPKDATATTLTQTITVKNATTSEVWDMRTNGVNVFRYKKSKLDIIIDAIDTFALFIPFIMNSIGVEGAQKNMEYYNSFAETTPPISSRKYKGIVPLSTVTEVHPGDVFFQSDLDGLGTTIAMATGSQANHVGIAIRNESSGKMMVCESTDPVIRCTDYDWWMNFAQFGSGLAKGTLVAPLKKELRDSFNNTKAYEFATQHVGLRYGYTNFIFGWIDTVNDNYPCLPDSFDTCLSWEIGKFAFYKLEEIVPNLAQTFVMYGLNNRLNVTQVPPKKYYPLAEVLEKAYKEQNLTGAELIATKERDSFRYPTLYKGKPVVARSMVCSTFTCFMLRAGGVFDSIHGDLECTEQTPWNMAAMDIYDANLLGPNRPAACVTADPNNNLCQLTGNWTFNLNVSTMAVRAQMGNTCGSRNPLYKHSKHC